MVVDDLERALDIDDRYQRWVYRHPIAGAALAGFLATQVATIWGYYGIGIGLPSAAMAMRRPTGSLSGGWRLSC